MARGKRKRSGRPELARDETRAAVSIDEHASVYPLTGQLHDLVDAIVTGCALTAEASGLADAIDEVSDADVLAESTAELELDLGDTASDEFLDDELDGEEPTDEEFGAAVTELGAAVGGVALTTRFLARALLTRALGREPSEVAPGFTPQPDDTGATEDDLLRGFTETLLPANLPSDARLTRAEQREAFDEAASLIMEVGLEEFDAICRLDTERDGSPRLVVQPRSAERAHVALLDYLFDRAESAASYMAPLVAVERDASWWEFSRWSASPPAGRQWRAEADFTRGVREQEYSLADHPSASLGTSVLEEIANDEGFGALFPRQHRMAAALVESFVDVFECLAIDGHRSTLRSLRDGRVYTVQEHSEPSVYEANWIGLGRLLPFRDETYLRSPGMIFVKPDDPNLAGAVTQAFGDMSRTLPPAVALEAVISAIVFGVSVPRTVKPTRSKADARAMLATIIVLLGAAEEEGEPVAVDATLAGYIAALEEQALISADAGGGHGKRQQKKKGTKAKKKTARRR